MKHDSQKELYFIRHGQTEWNAIRRMQGQWNSDLSETGRSQADAPEIDGEVHLRDTSGLEPGDIVSVTIEDADAHDLFGVPVNAT